MSGAPGRGLDGAAICAALLDAARKAGADAADALAAEGESLSVDTRGGRLESAERSEGVDIGLRVLIGRQQACVSASDARPETIAALAERAVAMARAAPDDPYCGLADPAQLAAEEDRDAGPLELVDPQGPPDPAEMERIALEAEAAAAAVPGVSQVEASGVGWGRSRFHLAATNGFSGGFERSSSSIYVSAIAGEGLGMERDHRAESRRRRSELPDPAEIGRDAGERAVARLGPRKPPTGPVRVIYDRRVSASLIGHLAAAANGASVARGASWLRDRLGKRVLPAGFRLIDEPRRVRGPASRPFDVEGIAARNRDIVRDGVLEGWTLDLASARKLGMETTGSATRGTGGPPHPGVTNLRLEAPGMTRDALLREMGTGLLITSLIGSSINPTTGDYSRGAAGFWIENGEIAYPANEVTVAGNLHDMLASLTAADDAEDCRASIVPSLMVEGLTLAGS